MDSNREELWLRLVYMNGHREYLKLRTYSNRWGDDDVWHSSLGLGTIGRFNQCILPVIESGSGLLHIDYEGFEEEERWIIVRNIAWFDLLTKEKYELYKGDV